MKVLITGSAGFIGFHLSKLLLEKGITVIGIDGMTDYYDIKLKDDRNKILESYDHFTFHRNMLSDTEKIVEIVKKNNVDTIVHLAAQAGVRYSIENPKSYIDSNIYGSFSILEVARICSIQHLLCASTSSVYGSNVEMPFIENQRTDSQLTIYSAPKKSMESMCHAYSDLLKIPITVFRFFTVYGPWGRPDMVLLKFVRSALNNESIDVYNNGNMFRDFTYVKDLVEAIRLLSSVPPSEEMESDGYFLSPYRIINIGNSTKVKLNDFIEAIEKKLDLKIKKNFMEMQKGDVHATWADCSELENLIGFKPSIKVEEGISEFIDWYKEYYSN